MWCEKFVLNTYLINEWHVPKKPAQLTPLNQTKRQFLYIKSANALLVCSISTVTTVPTVFFFFSFPSVFGLCFFFPFKYLCVLAYILLYRHNKFQNILNAQMPNSYSVLLVYSIGIVVRVPTVFFPFLFSHRFVLFFPFKYLYELAYILLYWHNKFHNILTIIEVSIFYRSK